MSGYCEYSQEFLLLRLVEEFTFCGLTLLRAILFLQCHSITVVLDYVVHVHRILS